MIKVYAKDTTYLEQLYIDNNFQERPSTAQAAVAASFSPIGAI
jgi:hypothetical protein